MSGVIVETEAYCGVVDRASHAWNGRRTPRNESMYGLPGTAYVYFTYGMHHCFNVVCGTVGDPLAVLVRALEPCAGVDSMRVRRGRDEPTDLCSGPGKLCQAMGIDRDLDGLDLTDDERLWIERPSPRAADRSPKIEIATGPRIGLGEVGEWKDKPLRFYRRGNVHVSRGTGVAGRAGRATRRANRG